MKQILNKLKKINTNENYMALMLLIVVLQPIFDLDYLFYTYLDPIGIPLPSTLFYFIGLPFIFILALLLKEQNKRKAVLLTTSILSIVLIYLFAHHIFVKDMFNLLYLTNLYDYTLTTEFRYVLTLIIPFGLVYAFYKGEITQKVINKVVIYSSIIISFPLFFSNLFLFGQSTYYNGPTLASFPTWFLGIYATTNPKHLATRFFFSEGNTIGIVLFSLYPLLIRQYFNTTKRWFILTLIIVQGWAMYVLATRVATYGVPLMLIVSLSVWIFLILLKKEKFVLKSFILLMLVLVMFVVSLPLTPAVKNLEVDNSNNQLVIDDEYLKDQFKEGINDEGLIPGTAEYNYYYQYIFEQYYWLLTISEEYYKWYYPYIIDPKFYVDLIFEYEFWERQSGRQFQQIFFDYKWSKLSDTQKLFGFGYSRFMMGSILLEQDFVMQKYTLGYIGMGLLTFPWVGILIYMLYKALKNIKSIFDFDCIVLAIAFSAILGGAYMSGHVLDQFLSSTFLAFYAGVLLYKLNRLNKEN